jgi:hypothetical protein
MPRGTARRRSGTRCPDPACGEIEPNGYLLSINHGFDPEIPGHAPRDGRCSQFRSLQVCTHKLHNVHQLAAGTFSGDCTCRTLDGITAASEADLTALVEQHRQAVTAELAPNEEWARR